MSYGGCWVVIWLSWIVIVGVGYVDGYLWVIGCKEGGCKESGCEGVVVIDG